MPNSSASSSSKVTISQNSSSAQHTSKAAANTEIQSHLCNNIVEYSSTSTVGGENACFSAHVLYQRPLVRIEISDERNQPQSSSNKPRTATLRGECSGDYSIDESSTKRKYHTYHQLFCLYFLRGRGWYYSRKLKVAKQMGKFFRFSSHSGDFKGDVSTKGSNGTTTFREFRVDDVDRNADFYVDNEVVNSRYTIISFLPKNIFEQFRRPLNLYFLFVVILQFIPIIAPVNPLSTLLPLLFAFGLTAVKEGFDDIKRHRADAAYNSTKQTVLRNGQWTTVKSKDMHVGDVLKLQRHNEIPCDCICVAAPPEARGTVFIRTENLDGEIDLKTRDVVPSVDVASSNSGDAPSSPSLTGASELTTESSVQEIFAYTQRLRLRAPLPNPILDRDAFNATLYVRAAGAPSRTDGNNQHEGETKRQEISVPLSSRHLLLQSAYLKGVDSIVAVVVYTGNETKSGMNKKPVPVKWAQLDKLVSRYAMVIFVLQMLAALGFGLYAYFSNKKRVETAWYLALGQESDGKSGFDINLVIYPARFFLLTTIMIPISFKFMVDMAKYFMSKVLEWDLEMWDDERGEGMRVNNSGIVENLAQVRYVLSDKTGTLTKNEMVLCGFSVAGEIIVDLTSLENRRSSSGQQLDDLMLLTALCNSIEVTGDPSRPYSSISPDEEALAAGVATLGAELVSRTRTEAVVNLRGVTHRFAVLEVFAFSSERKCMSVLLQQLQPPPQPGQEYVLLTKGADEKMLDIALNESRHSRTTKMMVDHISHFASLGLRTLVMAKRVIPQQVLQKFQEDLDKAQREMIDRDDKVSAVHRKLERDMRIVGATAVEDKLEDEVGMSIKKLLAANIKVWMLTGDKLETAHQIAKSCGLFPMSEKGDALYDLITLDENTDWQNTLMHTAISQRGDDSDASRHRSVDRLNLRDNADAHDDSSGTGLTILVTGTILHQILDNETYKARFLKIAQSCKAVVCARVAPSQKAAVTRLVNGTGELTLAIGDGGNDVAMINEAAVGIGIIGKEGQQSARAADFAITEFRHLCKLLLFHGHVSYRRTCFIVQYAFYKSMLLAFIQIVYNIAGAGMSGVSFWNSLFLTVWNGAFTLFQPLCYCLDRVAPRHVLEQTPVLYRYPQAGYGLTAYSFAGCVLIGAAQSALLFVVMSYHYSDTVSRNGFTESHDVLMTVMYTILIVVQVPILLLHSYSVTLLNFLVIVLMPLIYCLFTWVYNAVPFSTFHLEYFGVWNQSMSTIHWLFALLIVMMFTVPHITYRAAGRYVVGLDGVQRRREMAVLRKYDYAMRKNAYQKTSWFGKLWAAWAEDYGYPIPCPDRKGVPVPDSSHLYGLSSQAGGGRASSFQLHGSSSVASLRAQGSGKNSSSSSSHGGGGNSGVFPAASGVTTINGSENESRHHDTNANNNNQHHRAPTPTSHFNAIV